MQMPKATKDQADSDHVAIPVLIIHCLSMFSIFNATKGQFPCLNICILFSLSLYGIQIDGHPLQSIHTMSGESCSSTYLCIASKMSVMFLCPAVNSLPQCLTRQLTPLMQCSRHTLNIFTLFSGISYCEA